MKNNKKIIFVSAFYLLFASVLGSTVFAQDAVPQLMAVNQLQVKPNMMGRFLELHQNVYIPAGRSSGSAWRYTGATVMGTDFQISVVVPIDNFASMDEAPVFGASETEAALAIEIWRNSVISRERFVLRSRPDISMEALPTSDLYSTYRVVVKPGKSAEFEALWTGKVLPALRRANIEGTQVYQVALGGNTSEYLTRTPISGFSALDAGPPFRALSPRDQAELTEEFGALVDLMEFTVVATNRELSYGLPGLQP